MLISVGEIDGSFFVSNVSLIKNLCLHKQRKFRKLLMNLAFNNLTKTHLHPEIRGIGNFQNKRELYSENLDF